MVTQNVETNLDIVNRARGTIVGITLHPDEPTVSKGTSQCMELQRSTLTAVYPGGAAADTGHTAHWIGRMHSTCTIFGNAIAGGYSLFVSIWQVFVSIVNVS